ncbi:MAG: hypothetical protein PHU29_03595 [Sulfuricurvum sp.]|nr:hypothetical protein [Sulfuricurvum sp.]
MEKKSSSPLVFALFSMIVISIIYFYQNADAENIDTPKEVAVNFKDLNGEMSESDVVTRYADLKLSCGNEPSPIAERYCYSDVKKFNGMDAKLIAFFFEKDKLTTVKVDVQANSNDILSQYSKDYGAATDVKKQNGSEQLVTWILSNGILVTSAEENNKHGMLMWVSSMKVLSKAFAKK